LLDSAAPQTASVTSTGGRLRRLLGLKS
jgi:hypothetical protein